MHLLKWCIFYQLLLEICLAISTLLIKTKELLILKDSDQETPLDPTTVKHIITAAEDTRIALRLSELVTEIEDQAELENQSNTENISERKQKIFRS